MATLDQSLSELANTEIGSTIPASLLTQALSTPPFVPIPGAFNIRDIGFAASPYVRRGLIYRSGSLSYLADEGKAALSSLLSIKLVLDLRSQRERQAIPAPEIPGIKVVWLPSERELKATNLDDFVGEKGGERGFTDTYKEVLETYAPSFKHVLEHLRDEEGASVLFHCTGKPDVMLPFLLAGLQVAHASDRATR
jgi:protein tyrosine/serine phosphatase